MMEDAGETFKYTTTSGGSRTIPKYEFGKELTQAQYTEKLKALTATNQIAKTVTNRVDAR